MFDARAYNREWNRAHKDKRRAYYKTWLEKNKERRKEYMRQWREDHKDLVALHQRKYSTDHKSEIRVRRNKRRMERYYGDPKFKVDYLMSGSLNKRTGLKRGTHWENMVGYTIEELMDHLENQFTPEMNWSNHGSYWHIDHIRPLTTFHYKSVEDPEFKSAWALSNLRPLPASENLSRPKGRYQVCHA